MRVISGKKRGTKLEAPEGMTTRPTTDRIKETLFNMIAFDLPECVFLDLFSGSGAIGIEALSRGAKEATFVECNPVAVKCIENNLTKTKFNDNANILRTDIYEAIHKLEKENYKCDIIFLDPPYFDVDIQQVMEALAMSTLLNKEGYIILEQSTQHKISEVKGLINKREKHFKTTTISFFERI